MKTNQLKITCAILFCISAICTKAQFICELGQRTTIVNNSANFELSALAYHQNRNLFFMPLDDQLQGTRVRAYDNNTGNSFSVGLEGTLNNVDFEGLTWLEQDYFVLVEEKENEIYFLQYTHSSNLNNRKFTVLSSHLTNIPFVQDGNDEDGLEGAGYNPHLKTLYLVSEMNFTLYSLPIVLPQGSFKGGIITTELSEAQLPFVTGACASGIFHLGINLSANHLLSNNILVLSDELQKVFEFQLELDANNKLTNNSLIYINDFSLNSQPQAEGIVVADNKLFIASELQNGGLSSYPITTENDSCNDGNPQTINDTYDENCECSGEPLCQTIFAEVEIGYKRCRGFIEIKNISNGASPYQVSWSNGDTGSKIESLFTGIYSLTITDANNCTFQADYTIDLSLPFEAFGTVQNASAENSNDGTIDLTVTGGTLPYTYFWQNDNDMFLSNQEDIDGLLPGIYLVTIKDAKGCQIAEGVNVETDCLNDILISSNLEDNTNTFEPLNSLYQSGKSITTQSTASNLPDVLINADEIVDLKSNHITLDAGFKVESGGCLNAVINPCE